MRFFFILIFSPVLVTLGLLDVALLNLLLNSFVRVIECKLALRIAAEVPNNAGSEVDGSEYEQHGTASKLSSNSNVFA